MLNYHKQQYKNILNHSEENYQLWVNRLNDLCDKYKQYGLTKTEANINGLAESIDEMLNERRKQNLKIRRN